MVRLPVIHSAQELSALIEEMGMLPAFEGRIAGFSIEACIDPAYWFPDEGEGFWEWKGPVIRSSGAAYGKFFGGKAGYIMPDLYAEFANCRREGTDFDARYAGGLVRYEDKRVYDVLRERRSLLSRDLSRLSFGPGGRKPFDAAITRLQMRGDAVVSNFEYDRRQDGAPYGWGIARYETPEYRFGADFVQRVYAHEPEESRELLFDHLRRTLPGAPERELWRLIG